MFEQASRLKLRFNTVKGNITTEDLWDLPLSSARGASLDSLAKALYKQVREGSEVSFVSELGKDKAHTLLELKFDIVKHVIDVKLAERRATREAVAKKAQREKIMGIIADKEDTVLSGRSIEELRKMVEDLS